MADETSTRVSAYWHAALRRCEHALMGRLHPVYSLRESESRVVQALVDNTTSEWIIMPKVHAPPEITGRDRHRGRSSCSWGGRRGEGFRSEDRDG